MTEGQKRQRNVDPLLTALADARRARGLTQEVLAARIGISQSNLSDWERGGKALRLSSLRRWLDALGCDLTVTPRGES